MSQSCPNCDAIFEDIASGSCPECGQTLAHGPSGQSEHIQAEQLISDSYIPVPGDDSLVYVGRFHSPEEAELARVYLETQGIKAANAGGAAGVDFIYRGVPLGSMLAVRKSDAERAARLLKIAGLRKKEDDALPLNRAVSLMVSSVVFLFVLFIVVMLLTMIFGLLK
jgi:hypothetical protein